MFVFGGEADGIDYSLNDVLAFNIESKEWIPIQTTGTVPPARHSHSMVIDESKRTLIIFGGSFKNDVFSLDIGQFKSLDAGSPPPPHCSSFKTK